MSIELLNTRRTPIVLTAGCAAVVGLCVVFAVTAGPDEPPAARDVPAATAAGDPKVHHHRRNDEGGGFDLRPRLTQTSHFTGTTNTGVSPEIVFYARNVGPENVDAVAEQVRARAAFVDAAGHKLAAVAHTAALLGTAYTHSISLTPRQPLAIDAWYTLAIERDPGVVIGGPEDILDDDDAPKQIRLFTGSAPQIRRISRAADPGKPSQIEIVMSEPIELGELVRQGFEVQLGAKPLAGCVVWDAGCITGAAAAAPVKTSAFSFRPAAPLVSGRAIDLTVAISARVHGEGRSIEDGAALTRLALDASTGARRHLVALAPSAWNLCSDTGDMHCWRSNP